jgi:hypothetical protein
VASRRSRQFATAIFVALALLAAVIVWRLVAAGPTVAVGSTYPMSYVAVYQVTQNDVPLWEVVSVQRPLLGSDLMYRSAGVPAHDAQPLSGSISTATGLYSVGARGIQLVSARQPGPPSGDQALGIEIAELVRRGLATDLSTTSDVAGRRCAVYRFLKPPSGAIPPYSGDADHDDVCLDADGLVLMETWTLGGRVALQRTARDVRTSAGTTVESSAPTAPSTDSAQPPSTAAATLTADPNPATFIAVPAPPAGFTANGPALDFRLPDPSTPSQSVATTIVWTFTSGARVVTVEAGRERGGGLPWRSGDTATESVTLAGLGQAMTAARSDGFELRVDLGGGQWVRVHSTGSLEQLVAYGQTLSHGAAPTGA